MNTKKIAPLVVVLTACYGSPATWSSTDTNGATQSSLQIIGPEGGTTSLPGGASIEVPAGALDAATTITITATPASATPGGAVGQAYTFGPEGLTFAAPATITLPFEAARVPDEAAVSVLTAPGGTMDFTPLGGIASDASHVQAKTLHFSTFVVAATPPTTLVTGENFPGELLVSSGHLYWVNQGNSGNQAARGEGLVMSAATNGSGVSVLAASQLGPKSLALGGSRIFWSNGGQTAPVGGPTGAAILALDLLAAATPSVVVPSLGFPVALAANTTNLYWADADRSAVSTAPITGSPVTALSAAQHKPRSLALAGSYVYWTSTVDGTISRAPANGSGPPAVVVSAQAQPAGLAIASSSMFWCNTGDGTVWKANLDGTGATMLASGQAKPFAIASDGISTYWTNQGDGTVAKHSTATGLSFVATGQHVPFGITLDSTNVYWTNNGNVAFDGSVKSAPKLPTRTRYAVSVEYVLALR